VQVITHLHALARSKDLLYMLTWRDIRIRYKQSIMGFFWAILMPSMVVGAGLLVRFAAAQFSGSQLSRASITSVMVRAVAWSFFIGGIRFGTSSLVANPNLVTKIAFPKEVFPISAVIANLFDFAIAFVAVIVVMFFLGWTPTPNALWTLPIMVLLCALTMGLAMFLSAANLFFRDVKYIVEAFLTYAIFFTPVLYDASSLGKWKDWVLLNPVAPLLEGLATTLAAGQPPEMSWLIYSAVFSVVILFVSYALFKRFESTFAESI
jgi:lipopolysaccharide transport system permease protein